MQTQQTTASPVTAEQNSNILTWLVLGILLLQVILSAGLLLRINQVYQLAMASPANILRTESHYVPHISPGPGPALGPDDAPVTIVAFSDYTCGACGQVQDTLQQVQRQYPQAVRIVYRHFPGGGAGYPGYNAALAAVCAAEQGAFWEMHALLFEHAPAFDRGSLRVYAAQLALDRATFETCLDSTPILLY